MLLRSLLARIDSERNVRYIWIFVQNDLGRLWCHNHCWEVVNLKCFLIIFLLDQNPVNIYIQLAVEDCHCKTIKVSHFFFKLSTLNRIWHCLRCRGNVGAVENACETPFFIHIHIRNPECVMIPWVPSPPKNHIENFWVRSEENFCFSQISITTR